MATRIPNYNPITGQRDLYFGDSQRAFLNGPQGMTEANMGTRRNLPTAKLGPMQQAFLRGPQGMTPSSMSPLTPIGPMQHLFASGPQVVNPANITTKLVPTTAPTVIPPTNVLSPMEQYLKLAEDAIVTQHGQASANPQPVYKSGTLLSPTLTPQPTSFLSRLPSMVGPALRGLGVVGAVGTVANELFNPWSEDVQRLIAKEQLTGMRDVPNTSAPAQPVYQPTPAVYSGDVGMMARHAMPIQSPAYSPAVAAQIAQRRAAMSSPSLTDRLNRESQIRETVTPMGIDPTLDPSYNPDNYYGY
jgi:hypothetical protein